MKSKAVVPLVAVLIEVTKFEPEKRDKIVWRAVFLLEFSVVTAVNAVLSLSKACGASLVIYETRV
jgi:hypothetical protein